MEHTYKIPVEPKKKIIMRREKLKKIAMCYAHDELKDNHAPVEDIVAAALLDGIDYAEQHQWISVEDELPPRWETNPNVSVPVITFGTLGESSIPFVELQRYHFGDGRWLYGKTTHWMPFQYPKKGDKE